MTNAIPSESRNETSKDSALAPRRSTGWTPFETLRQEMDRIFDHFGAGTFQDPLQRVASSFNLPRSTTISPAVDVKESNASYDLSVELAGMDEKDVQLIVDGHLMTLTGEKSEESQKSENNYHVAERRFGSFSRSFRIPDNADASKIDAQFAKGVLRIKIPKLPGATNERKTIPVKAA